MNIFYFIILYVDDIKFFDRVVVMDDRVKIVIYRLSLVR